MKERAKRNSIPELISEKIVEIVGQNREITELDKKKLVYYIYVLYVNITKMVIILAIACLLNIFKEVFIIWAFFAIQRKFAFGIHSSNSISCTIVSILIFIGGGLVNKYFTLPIYIVYLIYAMVLLAYIIYAPADTESRPLVGKKLRKKFKIKTIVTFTFLFALVMILNSHQIKTLFAISALAETISILPITYKVFKRRYNNYEYFKKGRK
ncbi:MULTISPECIES: accessory gene regulator B family protein [Clostridium]|uniref:Accessory gene regulator B family protein n=1 Tax=Clostridium cibarium TaxID=2762247 RepID=A0ABR8PPK2_9CLOT|nr:MULTISPECIES: accessory gene regulator B family protein [Clostridium]MBD7910109.1 accessory gene regulator B family protein [Clostridium cibarium]